MTVSFHPLSGFLHWLTSAIDSDCFKAAIFPLILSMDEEGKKDVKNFRRGTQWRKAMCERGWEREKEEGRGNAGERE